jgi:hypothetical protein
MAQANFKSALIQDGNSTADIASDASALAYANGQIDRLVEAMRYSLKSQIAGLPQDDRALNTYEAVRHLLRNISMGHASYMEADYLNPELTRMSATGRIQFQLPSVDCVYHTALLHGDHTYHLRGNRGTAMIFQVTTYRGNAAELVDWKTRCVANNFDTPALAAGKDIDIVLSRTKPADLAAGAFWMELPEGVCELHLRQYYGNWDTEQPADLHIVREDQIFPAPILSRERAELGFNRLLNFLRVHADFGRKGVQAHLDADPNEVPELVVPGAFEGTRYYNGHFRCQPDQAAILEFEDPGAMYWNVELVNQQWEPGDFWTRLSSYNKTQVHTDSDGRIRLVASWQDPGVPNWLDCSGRVLTLMGFRFFHARKPIVKPRIKVVPLAAVQEHLPPGPVVSAAERYDLLKRRYLSVYRRRYSDF